MKKRGSNHLEMIFSFLIFISTVGVAYVYFNPIQQANPSMSAFESNQLHKSFYDLMKVNITKSTIIINTSVDIETNESINSIAVDLGYTIPLSQGVRVTTAKEEPLPVEINSTQRNIIYFTWNQTNGSLLYVLTGENVEAYFNSSPKFNKIPGPRCGDGISRPDFKLSCEQCDDGDSDEGLGNLCSNQCQDQEQVNVVFSPGTCPASSPPEFIDARSKRIFFSTPREGATFNFPLGNPVHIKIIYDPARFSPSKIWWNNGTANFSYISELDYNFPQGTHYITAYGNSTSNIIYSQRIMIQVGPSLSTFIPTEPTETCSGSCLGKEIVAGSYLGSFTQAGNSVSYTRLLSQIFESAPASATLLCRNTTSSCPPRNPPSLVPNKSIYRIVSTNFMELLSEKKLWFYNATYGASDIGYNLVKTQLDIPAGTDFGFIVRLPQTGYTVRAMRPVPQGVEIRSELGQSTLYLRNDTTITSAEFAITTW